MEGPRKLERIVGAKERRARDVIAHEIADDRGQRRLNNLGVWSWLRLAYNLAGAISDLEHRLRLHIASVVGQGVVGRGEVQQRNLATTQGHGQSVVAIFALQAGNAHAMEQVARLANPGFVQREHRRNVERVGQRLAHTNRSVPFTIVVLGTEIDSAFLGRALVDILLCGALDNREARLDVPQNGARREFALMHCRKIGKGLERRAGLTLARRNIDLAIKDVFLFTFGGRGLDRVVVNRANHRQNLAGARLLHHHGGVVNIALFRLKLLDALFGRFLGDLLHLKVERGGDGQTTFSGEERSKLRIIFEYLFDIIYKMRCFQRGLLINNHQILRDCIPGLLVGDHVVGNHLAQHVDLACPRRRRVERQSVARDAPVAL